MLIAPETSDYGRFEKMAETYIARGELTRCSNIMQLLGKMEKVRTFGIGEYALLKQIFSDIQLTDALDLVNTTETEIEKFRKRSETARIDEDVIYPDRLTTGAGTGADKTEEGATYNAKIESKTKSREPCVEASVVQSSQFDHVSSLKPSNDMKFRCRQESMKHLSTIPAAGTRGVNGIALYGGNTVFVCTEGDLLRYDGDGIRPTWRDASPLFKTNGRAFGVSIDNTTIVVCTLGKAQPVQLIVSDIAATFPTTFTLPFRSVLSAVVCGHPLVGHPTYFVTEEQATCRAANNIDRKGKVLKTYGKGYLKAPSGVAVDIRGDVVVADVTLNDVIMFSRDGNIKRRLRQHNNLDDKQMSEPWGVCIDQEGYIFVISHDTDSVLLFSPTGDYIRTVLSKKDGIRSPTHIAVSQGGHLAVVLENCGEIKVYTYMD